MAVLYFGAELALIVLFTVSKGTLRDALTFATSFAPMFPALRDVAACAKRILFSTWPNFDTPNLRLMTIEWLMINLHIVPKMEPLTLSVAALLFVVKNLSTEEHQQRTSRRSI